MLESTKWKKYRLSQNKSDVDIKGKDRKNLEHWTLVYYNPIISDYQLLGVITKVTENDIIFLGDPAIIDSQRFGESAISYLIEEIEE